MTSLNNIASEYKTGHRGAQLRATYPEFLPTPAITNRIRICAPILTDVRLNKVTGVFFVSKQWKRIRATRFCKSDRYSSYLLCPSFCPSERLSVPLVFQTFPVIIVRIHLNSQGRFSGKLFLYQYLKCTFECNMVCCSAVPLHDYLNIFSSYFVQRRWPRLEGF